MKSRFEKEITGELGEFWKKHADYEVERLVSSVDRGASVDLEGAISWNSNGNYLADDACEKLEWAGYKFDRKTTAEKRSRQLDQIIDRARREIAKTSVTDEYIAELTAAFGIGTTVVNILTGEEIQL